MVGTIAGAEQITEAGYQIRPLVMPSEVTRAIAEAPVPIIAIVVPESALASYIGSLSVAGSGDIVFAVSRADEIPDIIARLDALL